MRESINERTGDRRLNWPNLITWLRIVGSPCLLVLALLGQPLWLLVGAVILVCTEWLDGFLARRLQAGSAAGARLDTVADTAFYTSLLCAVCILNPTLVRDEMIWIAAAAGSYLCSCLASWIKFRWLPSYHTWAAKSGWFVVGAGTICLLAGWAAWPFRAAMVCVVLTNLEAVAITLVLPSPRVDVPSLWHALRTARGSREGTAV
jgi:CDP-diacylglycerol--glycerol-3-phosphate 3-phosphatidyltransferase